MKPRFVLALGLFVGVSTAALAQQLQVSSCPGGALGSRNLTAQDACQKTIDLFQYMAPQLGGAITGGNATLGQGGALGGLGHFSIGIRANVIQGSVPKIDAISVTPVPTGAVHSVFETSDLPLPMPTADGAVGIYGGFPLGLTNILALDGLVSASYVPNINRSSVSLEPDNPVKLGFGARVGLIQESIVTPGLAVTYLWRDLPVMAITGNSNGATLKVKDFDEETNAWRVVASKSLVMFGLTLGIGQDKYHSTATVVASALTQTSDTLRVSQEMSRTNVFGDVSLNMPIFKVVLEGGQITGGADPGTFNSFKGRGIVDSRLYGSLGIRFAW